MFKVQGVLVDDEDTALIMLADELLVLLIETLQIVDTDGLFTLPTAFLYIAEEVRQRGTQIDHQVGHRHQADNLFKKGHKSLIIAFREVALHVVVLDKHIDTLVQRAVLDDGAGTVGDVEQFDETLFQEEHLHVERPAAYIFVIIFQIGILDNDLVHGLPSIMVSQHPRERRFARTYVTCYGDVHNE